ncbi:transglutaminase-like domain-containing protein [Flavobacterium sp.]|uniref:transglutaminase-like domain-containing protein n=1 Tax=Flavobacterium sp. TaxID=239 RepID=UPI00263133BE|nr:transglutaminase-like domain-containing protein [Flavobacterium sp.]
MKGILHCLLLLLLSAPLWGQNNKSKYIYYNESVTIRNDKKLRIENEVTYSKLVAKAKERQHTVESVSYDSFSDINGLTANTTILATNKNYSNSTAVTSDVFLDNIFHSDYKKKTIHFLNVQDNSLLNLKYKKEYYEPKLLDGFYFQNTIEVESAKLTIKCPKSVEIGYSLFGYDRDKIVFNKVTEGDTVLYTWEMKNVPAFEPEEDMPGTSYVVPHIVYYINNYTVNGKKEEMLGNSDNLYNWYRSLVKDMNKSDQSAVKAKAEALIKGKTSDYDKAKAIFDWVQENLHYVAYEDGMGGFVPRDAALVFTRKYGDCKDMANITNELLRYAGLKSYVTWIGTRQRNYTYKELPSPLADNHMITCLELDGKKYFLDATGKYSQFPMPTDMIQGKEALIGLGDGYVIEKVPIIDKKTNGINLNADLKILDNALIGKVKANFSGFYKMRLAGMLANNYQKENEIWKSLLLATNNKAEIQIVATSIKPYETTPVHAEYELKLDNWAKNIEGKLIVKPILFFPLKSALIDVDKRKYPVENDFEQHNDITYTIEIPEGYTVEYLPKNNKQENELLGFQISYTQKNNLLIVKQEVYSTALLLEKENFQQWNDIVNQLINQYNQSIILKKA